LKALSRNRTLSELQLALGPVFTNINLARHLLSLPETMAENIPPSTNPPHNSTNAADVPGQPYYEKTRRHLQELLRKKNLLTNSLAILEDQIYKKETEYLEETSQGNIIIGFENYTKGTGGGIGGGGGRKRGMGILEGNRVFSRSSVGFGAVVSDLIIGQNFS
jgi:hypothetical protein